MRARSNSEFGSSRGRSIQRIEAPIQLLVCLDLIGMGEQTMSHIGSPCINTALAVPLRRGKLLERGSTGNSRGSTEAE